MAKKTEKLTEQQLKTDEIWSYARVSTINQADNESYDVQFKETVAAASLRGDEIGNFIRDLDSGAKESRKGIEEIRQAVRDGRCRKLYIYAYDRFSRDLLLNEQLYRELVGAGCRIISVREQFEDGPLGDLMRQIVAAFAQYERAVIKSRLMKGRENRIKREGTWGGGPAVYGYRPTRDNPGQLTLIPKEAEGVRLIFKLRLQGMSYHDIAEHMNRYGYKTVKGLPFNRDSVRRILQNEPFYRGERANFKGIVCEKVAHEPILHPREHPDDPDVYTLPLQNDKKKNKVKKNTLWVTEELLYAIKTMYDLCAEGHKPNKIAEIIAELGYKNPVGKPISKWMVYRYIASKKLILPYLPGYNGDMIEKYSNIRTKLTYGVGRAKDLPNELQFLDEHSLDIFDTSTFNRILELMKKPGMNAWKATPLLRAEGRYERSGAEICDAHVYEAFKTGVMPKYKKWVNVRGYGLQPTIPPAAG